MVVIPSLTRLEASDASDLLSVAGDVFRVPWPDAAFSGDAVLEMRELIDRLNSGREHGASAVARVIRQADQLRALGIGLDVTNELAMLAERHRMISGVVDWLQSARPTAVQLRPAVALSLQPVVDEAIAALESTCTELADYMEAIRTATAGSLPPAEAAPVNRAFAAYRAAILRHMPDARIADDAFGLADQRGEIIPNLTVQVSDDLPAELRIQFEELAHAEVEAIDPSLGGLLSIRYVPQ
jgi:hypothetical protein